MWSNHQVDMVVPERDWLRAQAAAGIGAQEPPSQEYSGIAMALERLAPVMKDLAPVMKDADTSRNLRWQQEVDRDANKLTFWKLARLVIPVGILRIPVFSAPVALFSQESRFLFRRNFFGSSSGNLSVWGLHRKLRRISIC